MNWKQFKTAFMTNFEEDETLHTLLMKISSIRLESKEKVKDFNQMFLTLLNEFPTTTEPNDIVLMEWYTKDISHSMAMWVKMSRNAPFNETFDEAIKVEKEMPSLSTNME